MSFSRKLIQAYFNIAYNQVYDFTTARLSRYQKLQGTCIGKLEWKDDDEVLCVGVGTGNEIVRILQVNENVKIVGIDYSPVALRKAHEKALRLGKEIEIANMDAKRLEFANSRFDKVICLHVMDFIEEPVEVTSEMFRVLKDGGQFVITYPSDKEGPKLGFNLLRDSIRHNRDSGKHSIMTFLEFAARLVAGPVYLPILLRPNKRSYSTIELEKMITGVTSGDFQIEKDDVYQDLIVYGRKSTEGGKSNAC